VEAAVVLAAVVDAAVVDAAVVLAAVVTAEELFEDVDELMLPPAPTPELGWHMIMPPLPSGTLWPRQSMHVQSSPWLGLHTPSSLHLPLQ
jgi:hypothetical protein